MLIDLLTDIHPSVRKLAHAAGPLVLFVLLGLVMLHTVCKPTFPDKCRRCAAI
jgi:hypothetical protein